MAIEPGILFQGSVLNGARLYVPVPIRNGKLGAHIAWLDAVSSATIILELSSFLAIDQDLRRQAGEAWQWKNPGLTIAGPTATAADSTLVNVENVRQLLARLNILALANCNLDIRDGTYGQ